MKRLIVRDSSGIVVIDCKSCCGVLDASQEVSAICDCEDCLRESTNRLAAIEDILGDDYDLDRLKELVEADKLIGKTVYKIERWCDGTKGDCGSFVDCKDCDDYELKVYECSILGLDDAMQAIKNMGKTVFATYNEAEAKLYKTEK